LSSICSLTSNRKFGERDLPSKIPSHSMSSSTTISLSPTLEPQSSRPSCNSKENSATTSHGTAPAMRQLEMDV
jgi:hypothetical protein